jgi:succinoglycan biosynthesis transport protein ExoP
MSKNFELMRNVGVEVQSLPPTADVPLRIPVQGRELTATTAQESRDQTPEWMKAIFILRKHWRLSSIFAAVVLITVAAVTSSMKDVYEPTARMEVDPPGESFSLEGGTGGGDAEYFETQAQNLKSDRLAIDVIRKLRLDQNPDIVPDAKVRAQNQFQPGPEADVLNLTKAETAALGAFRGKLRVKRDTASRLISISFASHDPALAALITNSIINTFIEQSFEDQNRAVTKSTEWLSKQLDDIRQRMEESNRVLVEYQKTMGVADIGDGRSTFSEQLGDLDRQLTQAQGDRIQLQALLENVQRSSPDSLPEVRNNPVVQQLSEKLADVKAQLSQAMVVYGENHPTAKKMRSQRDELESQLRAQKLAILSSIHSSYAAAQAREKLMNSQVKGATEQLNRMERYNALKKEAQANSELYNSLLAKVKEAGIAATSRSSNLRVVDEARALTLPTRPNRFLNFAAGILVALLGGIAVALLREQMDTRIFTPDDLRGSIGTSNVAVLPVFSNNGQASALAQSRDLSVLASDDDVHFLLDRPSSPEAEALRSLHTSMMLSELGRPPQMVLVLSSLPGEGKTTVAVNLATMMAQQGSTCIVDADLRRGHVARAFGISSGVGLTDVLQGKIPLDRVLIEVPNVRNLTVVPAHSGDLNAGQLVCSERMREVLQELRQRFRFVIIDSAPVLPFADGRALSVVADGLIFVGRSGVTTREIVRHSLELLRKVHGAPILEFVLNAADIDASQYRYHYQYAGAYSEEALSKPLGNKGREKECS